MNHRVPWPLLGVAMLAPAFSACPRKAVGMAPLLKKVIRNAAVNKMATAPAFSLGNRSDSTTGIEIIVRRAANLCIL
jgi:hypothetical protein